jgi:hypothetical protein
MILLSSAISGGFTWSRLPRKAGYELKFNGSVVGSLRRRSLRSSNYDASTLEGEFRIRRKGLCGTKAEIVDSASEQQIASFESGWRKPSILAFSDGQTFHITCKACWRPHWSVITASGQPVLALDVRRRTGNAVVGAGMKDSRLSLIIMFILYRIRQAEEDATASAVVAAISATTIS